MVRTITWVAFAGLLACTAARAADLPSREAAPAPAPVAVPTFAWSGFYIGAHAGYTWMHGKSRFDPIPFAGWNRSPETFSQSGGSVLGGVHVGYNWQFASNFLLGLEADWSLMGAKGSETVATRNGAGVPFAPVSPAFMNRKLNWLASGRARFGYASDNWLLYLTGGVAFGNVKYASNLSAVPPTSTWPINSSTTEVGYVVGAGAEYRLAANWTLRGEYLYYNLQGQNSTAVDSAGIFPGFTIAYRWRNTEAHIARVGLSYLFGGPASPVLARY